MEKKSKLGALSAGAFALYSGAMALLTRNAALLEGASTAQKLPFSLSLAVFFGALVFLGAFLLPGRPKTDTRTLTMAAMFAALCYIGFAVFKVDIPIGDSKTAFHLGNSFCVLAALFLGPLWGGLAGAVGLSIADLTSAYVTSAPKTFLMKLCIGLITGLVAHRVLQISSPKRKLPLPVGAFLASLAGMVFNVIADPIVGYFYKTYLLGMPQDAAKIWLSMAKVTTAANAAIAVLAATILYSALCPALRRSRLLPQ